MKGLKQAVEAEKLVAPLQISDVRKVDNGPGCYMICIAGHRSGKDDTGYYATFFENEVYKDVRPAVMYDFCEKQSYRPMN